MKDQKVYHIGKTTDNDKIVITNNNDIIIDDNLKELKNICKNSLIF